MLEELVVVLTLLGLALFGYTMKLLDAAGSIASFLLGLFVGLAGGLHWLALMLFFPIIGSLATAVGLQKKQDREVAEARDGERGVGNVIANGLAAALAVVASLLDQIPYDAAALAFAAAIAAVTADTLASEVGSLAKRARLIIPPFGERPPGQNGCVTWPGQWAALGGAILVGVLGMYLLQLPMQYWWIPALAGFLGCQLDSLLGATLERDDIADGPLGKGDVNFISSFVPALLVLVLWAIAS